MESIAFAAFIYCESLTSFVMGDQLVSIGQNAFYGCTSLKSVTIGSKVSLIETGAFNQCSNLTNVIFKSTSTWYVSNDSGAKELTVEEVKNTTTIAKYLRSTYATYKWERE